MTKDFNLEDIIRKVRLQEPDRWAVSITYDPDGTYHITTYITTIDNNVIELSRNISRIERKVKRKPERIKCTSYYFSVFRGRRDRNDITYNDDTDNAKDLYDHVSQEVEAYIQRNMVTYMMHPGVA